MKNIEQVKIAKKIKADLDARAIKELRSEMIKYIFYSTFWTVTFCSFTYINLIADNVIYRALGLIGIFSSVCMLAYTSAEIWLCVVGIKSAKQKWYDSWRCGQGENRCNCTHPNKCGYKYIAEELAKQGIYFTDCKEDSNSV